MADLLSKLFPKIPPGQKQRFRNRKFYRNNFRILILSSVLILEQILYASFVAGSGSSLRQVYFITAFLLCFFALTSLYFYFNQPENITLIYRLYEIGLGVFGLGTAVVRSTFIQTQMMGLPTVYLAVLYGVAVVFYLDYKQSLAVYLLSVLFFISLHSIRRPGLLSSKLLADAVANSFIAWIVSVVNYTRYVKAFLRTIAIEESNQKLKQKNEEIEKINEKLQDLSTTDELTNLFNRRKIKEVLDRIFQESKRYNDPFTIILIDLDNFKRINDSYGHQKGDETLREISPLIEENIREVDSCGRWGGEEFLVACPNTGKKAGVELAERLRKIIADASFNPGKELTASFGVATYSGEQNLERIIAKADEYLYKAKENGRDRVEPKFESVTL